MSSSQAGPRAGAPEPTQHTAPYGSGGRREGFTDAPVLREDIPYPCHQAGVLHTPHSPRLVDTQTYIFQSLESYLNIGVSPQHFWWKILNINQ